MVLIRGLSAYIHQGLLIAYAASTGLLSFSCILYIQGSLSLEFFLGLLSLSLSILQIALALHFYHKGILSREEQILLEAISRNPIAKEVLQFLCRNGPAWINLICRKTRKNKYEIARLVRNFEAQEILKPQIVRTENGHMVKAYSISEDLVGYLERFFNGIG